jgi:hypothetical protein
VYHENYDIIAAKDGRTSASIQAHAHILPAEQQQKSHHLRIKGVYPENYDIFGAQDGALPLASRRMRTSFLLNSSRSHTKSELKVEYHENNSVSTIGAKDECTATSGP